MNRIYPLLIEGCLNNGSRQTEPNSGFHFELDYIYKVVYLPSLLGDK